MLYDPNLTASFRADTSPPNSTSSSISNRASRVGGCSSCPCPFQQTQLPLSEQIRVLPTQHLQAFQIGRRVLILPLSFPADSAASFRAGTCPPNSTSSSISNRASLVGVCSSCPCPFQQTQLPLSEQARVLPTQHLQAFQIGHLR